MNEERPGEFELIARVFAPLAGQGALGLRDDAALLKPAPGFDLVLTKDLLVAGVHFFADDPAGLIARKALRVNLSDLAAKAARPLGFLLGLSLPGDWRFGWVEAFAAGLREDIAEFAAPLLGGDTTATPGPLTISITALGEVPAGRMPRREGARPGDLLYVTGTIGDGALGLLAHERMADPRLAGVPPADRAALVERYLLPRPRLALSEALRDHAHAAMDISDGFVGDLSKMLAGAGCGGRVELARIPLSPAARIAIAAEPALLDKALTGGDDYELLVAVPPGQGGSFEAAAELASTRVTCVGTVEPGEGLHLLDADLRERRFTAGSYVHFGRA